MKKCPYCAEEIQEEALKCKHCAEILDPELRAENEKKNQAPVHKEKKWNPGVAALLSFLFPGAGQMYKGQVGNGLVWFIVVVIGYTMMMVPGMILHLFCIVGASQDNPYK